MRILASFVLLALIMLLPLGCGYRSDLDRKVISGTVKCGGENVPRGFIRFVPAGNTRGPATSARIHNGQYRATNRGGVPLGTHRVEITAQRPTGKMIDLGGGQSIEELEQIGDKKYSGKQSTMVAEVTADGTDTMDFDIPK